MIYLNNVRYVVLHQPESGWKKKVGKSECVGFFFLYSM